MNSRLSILLLFTLFFICPKISFAGGDTIPGDTTKYALNDPRNPDCPCHAAQKKADEEYRKMMEQKANNPANNNGNNPVNNNPVNNNGNNSSGNSDSTITSTTISGSSGSGVSSKHYSKKMIEWKTMHKWMRKMKKSMIRKGKGTKKGKHRLADCFHWN